MSYYTDIEGMITFSPPLTWSEIKASDLDAGEDSRFGDTHDIQLDTRAETVEMPEGVLTRFSAASLIVACTDESRAYLIKDELEGFVKQFGQGRTFDGYFECTGVRQGDVWRLEVVNGKVVRTNAKLVWDDLSGLQEELRAATRLIRRLEGTQAIGLHQGEHNAHSGSDNCVGCDALRWVRDHE